MGASAMVASVSHQTTEKQKAILSSKVMQNVVWPIELNALKMQAQIVALLEGKKIKPLDEKELTLMAAYSEMHELELQKTWLAALVASMMYVNHEKGGEQDGQQRIDGV